jgi:hypothetical protein
MAQFAQGPVRHIIMEHTGMATRRRGVLKWMIAGASQGAALMPVMARAQTPAGTAPATINLPTVQALLASRQTWVAGTVIQVGSYFYRVPLAQDAAGHVTTAAGQGLEVIPHEGGIWAEQFGAVADDTPDDGPMARAGGATDNGTAFNAAARVARALQAAAAPAGGYYGFSTPLRLEDSGPNTRDNPGLQGAGWYKTFWSGAVATIARS